MKSVLTIACVLFAATASAQSLKVPTIVFAGAAAADWTTTYHNLSSKTAHERHPLLQWADDRPIPTVMAGAAIDAATIWAFNKFGKKHPRLATLGLYVMSGAAVVAATHNYKHRPRTHCGPVFTAC